jgi:MFS family permease
MGSTMNPINSSVIATALVTIAADTRSSIGTTTILVSALYLASAVAQPTCGKLAEELGPRRVFMAGAVIVFAAGIVGGLGNTLLVLTVARVLIGVGTSAAYPSAMLLIRRRATEAKLAEPPGTVLGGLAIAGQATLAVGPTIGGLLLAAFGWRSAFLLNLPLATTALVMAALWTPRDPPIAATDAPELADRIDLPGIVGFASSMICLLVFVMSIPDPDWISGAIGATIGAAFLWWELRARMPFVDMHLLASAPSLSRTYLRWGLTLFGSYTILYGFTEWLEAARGLSPGEVGLLLMPTGLLSAIISRRVASRNVVRAPLIISAISLVAAAIVTLFLTSHTSVAAILLVTVIFGVTQGTSSVSNQAALYQQAPPTKVGTAAGLLRTSGYIGAIAAASIISIEFHEGISDAGLHHISWVLLGIGVILVVLTTLDRHIGSKRGSLKRDAKRHHDV